MEPLRVVHPLQPLRVVLTGGPCGGKTSAITRLSDYYRLKGHSVYVGPEVATLLFNSGVDIKNKIRSHEEVLANKAIGIQLALEDALYNLAAHSQELLRPIILLDRGINDTKAYVSPETWNKVSQYHEISNDYEYYCYELIIHLVTAAIGAEQYFTNENNPARQCSLELARELDTRTQAVWERKKVIDNSTDFTGKLKRVISLIDSALND